jgi:hypothetical protein
MEIFTPCPARIVAPHSAQATSTLLRRFMEASLPGSSSWSFQWEKTGFRWV